MAVKEVDRLNYVDEVIDNVTPVLIDFWAEWCAPCKAMNPILNEVNDEVDGVKIVKVNVDKEPSLAADFKVTGIPTLVLMKAGKEVDRYVGAAPKSALVKFLTSHS